MNQTVLVGKVVKIDRSVGDEITLTLDVDRPNAKNDCYVNDDIKVKVYEEESMAKVDSLDVGTLVGVKCHNEVVNGGEQAIVVDKLTYLGV